MIQSLICSLGVARPSTAHIGHRAGSKALPNRLAQHIDRIPVGVERSLRSIVVSAVLGFTFTLPLIAQSSIPAQSPSVERPRPSTSYTEQELEKMVPAARPEDVSTPEAAIRALHQAVSGPRGDWNPDRLRSLVLPSVMFTYNDVGEDGVTRISTVTLDDCIREFKKIHQRTAWYEKVIDIPVLARIQRNAQVTLATLSAREIEGTQPIPDESNITTATTTFIYIEKRWWIVSHTW
jgi:hypothetical protein